MDQNFRITTKIENVPQLGVNRNNCTPCCLQDTKRFQEASFDHAFCPAFGTLLGCAFLSAPADLPCWDTATNLLAGMLAFPRTA
jgi:hypothetical protein